LSTVERVVTGAALDDISTATTIDGVGCVVTPQEVRQL
jgi:hypothetical protein